MRLTILFISSILFVNTTPIEDGIHKWKPISSLRQKNVKASEEDSMTTSEIIQNRGYPAEIHTVTTQDGYLIDIHRIPYGKNSGPAPNKPVVFLQHGLLSASTDWIMGPVNKALGYMLADSGYDVWLGNVRGNTYGRRHVSLDPDANNNTFWEFTFDEIGQFDVSANLRYVMQTTGQDKISYVGHSQGSLTFWIAMETNPDLNSHINIMFGLGPVATVANMISPINKIAPYADDLGWIMENLGIDEFLPSNDFFQLVGEGLCRENTTTVDICSSILFLLCGPDSEQLDESLLPLIVSHSPAGTSVRNVVHFAQEYNHKYYAHYDYGLLGNLQHYGQSTPPLYNLQAVQAPVILMWGQNDWLAVPQDVEWLASQLPNLKQNIRINNDLFNHLDFLWALDVDIYVNNFILETLAQYSGIFKV